MSRWLGRRAVPGAAWLAGISYSLYLSHKLVMHAVQQWLVPLLPWPGVALFAVYAVAILAGGAALHYAVERPGLHWRDRLGPLVGAGPQRRRAAG